MHSDISYNISVCPIGIPKQAFLLHGEKWENTLKIFRDFLTGNTFKTMRVGVYPI